MLDTNSKTTFFAGCFATVIAIGVPSVAMADADPETRAWSAFMVSQVKDGSFGGQVRITASASPHGSNSLVIEKVELLSTKTTEGADGMSMTEVTGILESSDGPFTIDGNSFSSEAPAPEGEDAPAAGNRAFSISGRMHHTYRRWISWDFEGTITRGDSSVGFAIETPRPALLIE